METGISSHLSNQSVHQAASRLRASSGDITHDVMLVTAGAWFDVSLATVVAPPFLNSSSFLNKTRHNYV